MASEPELTRLERLEALRDRQAEAMRDVPAREFAALSREYRATLVEIETLAPPAAKGDVVDEIAKRRAARGAGTAKSSRSSASDKG